MIYFYKYTKKLGEELSGHPRARPFERGYLNSEKYFHKMLDTGVSTFHSDKTNSKVDESIFRDMDYKISLSGMLIPLQGRTLYVLEKPWKSIVEIPHGIPPRDLISYDGGLPEYFYRKKIGIFGGPGSGKSCLSRSLTNFLSINMGIHADNSYEYATTHISRYGPPSFEDHLNIFYHQSRAENEISDHKQVCVSDCPSPLSYIYARDLARKSLKGTHHSLVLSYELALQSLESFDCRIFLPFRGERVVSDGIRLHNVMESVQLSKEIEKFLYDTGSPYVEGGDDLGALVDQLFLINNKFPCTD